jgi:PleD family two-component response regulator
MPLEKTPAQDQVAGARASILMVDDQPSRLLTFESILSNVDVNCVGALSPSDALERLLKNDLRSSCSTSRCPAWMASSWRG